MPARNHMSRDRFWLLFLLTNLALAQPLFDLFGRQAEFLVAHDLLGLQLVGYALALAVGVPVAVAALHWLVQRVHAGLGAVVFWVFALLLLMVTLSPPLIRHDIGGITALGLPALVGAVVLFAHQRYTMIRQFFRVFTLAVPVLLLLFLFQSRATPLLSGDSTASPQAATLPGFTPDIVIVVLDEFPLVSLLTGELEINAERFPNFAWLAAHANWYRNAVTGAEVTVDSVPEALTGLLSEPGADMLPISLNYPRNLFTLLADHYRVTAFETATVLCPRQLCYGAGSRDAPARARARLLQDSALAWAHIVTPRPWANALPSVSDGWSNFMAERVATMSPDRELEEAFAKADMSSRTQWQTRGGQFEDFVAQLEQRDEPALYYLHSLLPHRVWRYLPDGRQYLLDEVWAALDPPVPQPARVGDKLFGHRWQPDPWAIQTARQRHLLQVQYVDTLLGQLLSQLREQEMLEETLLVITGDHGASFEPGGPRRAITEESLTDISAVPLFIKLPNQSEGHAHDHPARLVDVLPTIMDVLDFDPLWEMDGSSLLGPEAPRRSSITVIKSEGEPFTYPSAHHAEHLAQRARKFARVYGVSRDFLALGEHAHLVGQRLEELATGPNEGGSVRLDAPHLYDNVDPGANFIPAHLMGRLEDVNTNSGPVTVAVAINGAVAAVTQTFVTEGHRDRFEALFDPSHLDAGRNQVEFFIVFGAAENVFLSPLEFGEAATPQLAIEGGAEMIIDEGKSVPLLSGPRPGSVVTAAIEGGDVLMVNGGLSRPAGEIRYIVAFLDGAFAGSVSPDRELFSIPLPLQATTNPQRHDLRVFAVGHEGAFEFDYPPACSSDWKFAAPELWGNVACSAEARNPFEEIAGDEVAVLDFTSATIRPYLGQGWQAEAGNVAWSVGQRADLLLPLPADLAGLKFTARVKPFLAPPALDRQRVFILVNGTEVARFELQDSGFSEIHWDVPGTLLTTEEASVQLSILTPDATSPQALGAGPDRRILGLAFIDLRLERIHENGEHAAREVGSVQDSE